MAEPYPEAVLAAVRFARARRCMKSARGVAIYDPVNVDRILGLGRNGPVLGKCDGSASCQSSCAKTCEHAEAAAIRHLGACERTRLDMVHVKVVDGEVVAGGPPSCWQCSKAILADGRIGGVWLFRAYDDRRAWHRFTAEYFHATTLRNCDLYGGQT